jgi:hypothetical protein
MAALFENAQPDESLRLERLVPIFEAPINSYAAIQGTMFYDLPNDDETFIVNAIDPVVEPPYLNIVHDWREVFDVATGN